MKIEKIYHFLSAIATNNNREWFAENKTQYLEAKTIFEEFTQAAINRIGLFDPSIRHLTVPDCTYRFYRDTRFSANKSPYKCHFGTYIAPRGKKGYHGGYYLHLEPGNSLIAGGCWELPPDMLRAVRRTVLDEIENFRTIVEEKHFAKAFPSIGMTHLKGAPKGFPKDSPYLKYIRCKDYSITCNVPDALYLAPNWLDQVEEKCRLMKPYLDFINDPISDYE